MSPGTKYAKSGEYSIAYKVIGDGPMDLVIIFGYISHLDLMSENPAFQRYMERLSKFARVIIHDKRGVGLSDPVDRLPTLEERMDDVRVVMDAVGCERASLFGMSEGVPMSILFAATYPERTDTLVLYGGMPRSTADVDYPYAPPIEAIQQSSEELMNPHWGQGTSIEVFAPSIADDPDARESFAKYERTAASPRAVEQLAKMFFQIDVRHVVPSVKVPALVLHRTGDRVVNVRAGRWLAEHLPNTKFVELPGIDHSPFVGDIDRIIDEIEEFLTGTRPVRELDRVLATVMFTDIVDSTRLAAEKGDTEWRQILGTHNQTMTTEIERYKGRAIKSTGDGFLATFDGPARAIRCALAAGDSMKRRGLEIRAGLHCGEIELMGQDIGGVAVHIAARIGALAGASEVLVSRTVRDLVAGSGIEFDDRGEHQLKGLPDSWQVLAVTGSS